MKVFFSLLLLVPTLASAASVSNLHLARLLDGHAFQCAATHELGRTGYFPEWISAADAGNGLLNLRIKMSFAVCQQEGSRFYWQSRLPLDSTTRSENGILVRTEYSDPRLVVSDEIFTPLLTLNLDNQSPAEVSFPVELTKVLDAEQARDYAAGKPVDTRVLITYSARATAHSDSGETELGRTIGQSYTLLFTLQK